MVQTIAPAAPLVCWRGRRGARPERPPLGLVLAGCMEAWLLLFLASALLLPGIVAQARETGPGTA